MTLTSGWASLASPVSSFFGRGGGRGGLGIAGPDQKKTHKFLSLHALSCLAPLVSSLITSDDVFKLPSVGTDRVQTLSVLTNGGPNTLSDVIGPHETHCKTRKGQDRPAM